MSDSDDDSSDSSDIEGMLSKVRQNKKRLSVESRDSDSGSASSGCGDDDDDDDDDDDKEGDCNNKQEKYAVLDAAHTSSSSRRKKTKKSIETELVLMQQQRAIANRRLQERMKQNKDSDDDDDDDEEEDEVQEVIKDKNAIAIVMESRVEGADCKHAICVDDDDDSSDDEVENNATIKIPQSAVLTKLAQAAASLQSAQQYQPSFSASAADTGFYNTAMSMSFATTTPFQTLATPLQPAKQSQLQAAALLQQQQQNLYANVSPAGLQAMSYLNMSSSSPALAAGSFLPAPTQLQLLVVAELVSPTTSTSAADTNPDHRPTTTTLTILSSDPLSVLQSKLLASLGLPPESAIVTLNCNQQTLKPKKTAQSYGLTTGATVNAKVHLLGLPTTMMMMDTTKTKKKTDLGRSIRLLLRRPNGNEVEIKTYMKEPFQVLLDKFCQQTGLSNNNMISFKFDGERLDLSQTPQSLDMDDEDLIDVIESKK